MKKESRKYLILLGVMLVLQILAREMGGFAEWYAVSVYPWIVGSIGRLVSLFPFSVVELLIYGGILLLAAALGKEIKRVKGGEEGIIDLLKRGLGLAGKVLIVLFFLFTVNCGINYHRTTFSELAGFQIQESSVEELKALCEHLTERINETAPLIDTDSNGLCQVNERSLSREAVLAMKAAGESYEQLSGYYPKAKPVLFSRFLSIQRIEGVYGAYTVEANYNRDIPDYDKPGTICHELSHLKGFMREDEANFIAYLACEVSENPTFVYSGNMLAYIYSMNALYAADSDAYMEIRGKLCEQGNRDMRAHNDFWEPYRTKVAEVSQKVNDAYLKANRQADGVKSYGRMVDLMLALYRE